MIVCVTGPRPNKLYGYNETHPGHKKLKDKLKSVLIELKCTEAITGMALGTDMVFAFAVLELKREGHDIKLHCAVPHRNHTAKWDKRNKQDHDYIIKHADTVKLVNDEEYKPWLLQKRNEYMVDLAEKVIAVWNESNTKGGTVNCINYAKKCKKDIIYIDPFNLDEK